MVASTTSLSLGLQVSYVKAVLGFPILIRQPGYTGQLASEHISAHLPTDLKWAVAGRTEAKLQKVVDECSKLNADRIPPGMTTSGIECIHAL